MMRITGLALIFLAVVVSGCATTAGAPGTSAARVSAEAESGASILLAGGSSAEPVAASAAQTPSNSVFFEKGRTDIDAAGMAVLRAQAEKIMAGGGSRVMLVGYTDQLGSAAYNLAISSKRVDAVFDVLRGLGVPPKLMRKFAVGHEKASRQCRSENCRKLSRRVTIEYGKERHNDRLSPRRK